MARRKLRVLVTRCSGPGGGQVWAHDYASRLAELGHDVRVVFLRAWWPGMRTHPTHGIGETGPVRYRPIFLDVPLFVEPYGLSRFLRGHLKHEPADVIVSTGCEAALVHRVRNGSSPLHVASFHSTYPDWIGFGQLILESVRLTRRGIARTYGHWTQHLDLFSMTRADQVVCSSRYQAERAVAGLSVPDPKVRVIYYGIDTERFVPLRTQQEPPGGEILFAGGPCPSKGIDTFLEALAIMKHRECTVSLVGGGNWAPYREKVRALGLSDRVRYHGHVSHDAMSDFYRKAYLLAAPTRHESFGLVIAEAMACGLPVVSTRVTAIPEVVADGKTGLLVPVDDATALAEAFDTLLANPERAAAMGAAGRARVEQHFAWDSIIRQWEQLLLRVADGGRA